MGAAWERHGMCELALRQLLPCFMVVTQFYSTEHMGVATQNFNHQVPGLHFAREPLTIIDGNGSILVIPEMCKYYFE
jgi:hypothetical protein